MQTRRPRPALLMAILALALAAVAFRGHHDLAWYQAHPDRARQLLATCPFKPDPDCALAEAALQALMAAERRAKHAKAMDHQ